MARAVGIELTDAGVRILSLDQSGKKSKILQFYEAPIPAGAEVPWEERATQALRRVPAAGAEAGRREAVEAAEPPKSRECWLCRVRAR